MRVPLTAAAVLVAGLALAGSGFLISGTGDAGAAPTAATGWSDDNQPVVDPRDAERTALASTGRGVVADVELDLGHRDDDPYGRHHWEVEIRDGATLLEVDVDATSGHVLSEETDLAEATGGTG